MQGRRSWFIAVYGAMFSSLFGIIFVIMLVYRNAGMSYFPDWDSFIVGYTQTLEGTWVGKAFGGIKDAFHWLSANMQDMITFGNWGSKGWYGFWTGAINLLLGTAPLIILGVAMIAFGIAYIFFLTIPILTSLGYIAGVNVTAHSITGGMGVVDYSQWTGMGYPPIESFSFISALI